MKCPKCGSTTFMNRIFMFLWEDEFIDLATGNLTREEVERDLKDSDGWTCSKCEHYVDDSDDEELFDAIDRAAWKEYERIWNESRDRR